MKAIAAFIVLGLAGTVVAGRQSLSPQETAGRKVYDREKCATCHQIDRRGNSRYPLDGVGSKLTEDEIRRWLTHPAEMEAALPRIPALRMSTMKSRLSAEDLGALVAYLRTLK